MARHPYRDAPPAPRPSRWRARGWLIPTIGIPLATLCAMYVMSLRTPGTARAHVSMEDVVPPQGPRPERHVEESPPPPPSLRSPPPPPPSPEVRRKEGGETAKAVASAGESAPQDVWYTVFPDPASLPTNGALFINTLPSSTCTVDGVPKGRTPLKLALPPGSYVVTCIATSGGGVYRRSVVPTVERGMRSSVFLKLS